MSQQSPSSSVTVTSLYSTIAQTYPHSEYAKARLTFYLQAACTGARDFQTATRLVYSGWDSYPISPEIAHIQTGVRDFLENHLRIPTTPEIIRRVLLEASV